MIVTALLLTQFLLGAAIQFPHGTTEADRQLFYAVRGLNKIQAKAAIDAGANGDVQDARGRTALMIAAESGSVIR